MFTAASFIIAKVWKHPKCPSIDKWIKMWYIYMMEYYSDIKRNGISPLVTTWMGLESTVLCETSWTERQMP